VILGLTCESREGVKYGGFMQMKELVEKIVRALVDFSEQVDIREIKGPRTNILEIKVSKQDGL